MNVAESAQRNHLQLIRNIVLEKNRGPVTSKRFRYSANDFVQQLFKIEYGIDLLCGLLQQTELANASF